MRKMIKYLSVLMLVPVITGCTYDNGNTGSARGHYGEDTEEYEEDPGSGEELYSDEDGDPGKIPVDSSGRKYYSKEIHNSIKPEVTEVIFSAVCDSDLENETDISDLYGRDVLHSGLVGLMGSPVELSYGQVLHPEICFVYDENSLGPVPETNLVMLHYNEQDYFYDTVKAFSVDTDNNTVSAPINEGGVYMLADAYQWYACWGMDVSQYAYDSDPTQVASTWEKRGETGSIMELADKDWAVANAPDFYVTTAEELASVVYYVNSFSGGYYQITLGNDIDLSGYDWMPIGWYGGGLGESHPFYGTVDGNSHEIRGMKIDLGYEDCGFIGYGTDVTLKDISIVGADVSGTACTGIAGGEIYGSSEWKNVYVHGNVTGGADDYGAIVGRETSISFTDCTAKVLVNQQPFPWFSYRQKILDETEIVESFTLTLNDDMTITRDEPDGEFRNLGWHIEHNGVQILDRSAENELVLETDYQWLDGSEGTHTIYLTAYINGTYIRVSNIIEYEL